jgi:hypothetical protein
MRDIGYDSNDFDRRRHFDDPTEGVAVFQKFTHECLVLLTFAFVPDPKAELVSVLFGCA